MKFIGEYLKSVRVQKKISIKQISDELKISQKIFIEIESDNFPEYISKVFLIGHIRSYCNYLGIDANEIINKFKIQTSFTDLNIEKEIPKPIETINFFSLPRSFSFISVLFIALCFYFLFIQPNDLEPNFAMTPDVPENFKYEIEEIEMNLALSNIEKTISKISSNIILEDSFSDNLSKKTSASSVIASLPKKKIKDIHKNINLKFLNSTWIQLRDLEDNIILSKLMQRGDEYSYSQKDNLSLTAGNGGNIIISFNGLVKGKAGRLGEVIDSLIIDNNFNN